MMQPLRFGRVFGIPLEARVSFLVMLGLVLLFLGGLSGVFVVLLAFSSVILHELGHALVARRLGVGVSGIELHFFGGVAKLQSQPKSNIDEIAIAAAGPAVSFVLSGIGFLLSFLTGWGIFELLATVNLVIAVFNLIPALPMDGGRILRAFLAGRVGFRRATELSVKISRGVSVAFAVLGLAFAQIQLVLLAGVLWYMASMELRNSQMVDAYRSQERGRHPLDDLMSQNYRPPQQRRGWSADPRSQGRPPIDDGPARIVIVRRR
jgi:Zn-dependent protease